MPNAWPELLTPEQVCERWNISRKTLTRWIAHGYIPGTREPFPYMRIGRRLRFHADQVTFIEARMCRVSRRAPRQRKAS